MQTKQARSVHRGLYYHLKLAWNELMEELRSDQPYSAFLLLLGLEILLLVGGTTFLYSNSNSYMLKRHLLWLGLGITLSFYYLFATCTYNGAVYSFFCYTSFIAQCFSTDTWFTIG